MKNTIITTLVAGAALSLSLPLAAAAQTQGPAVSADSGSPMPGTYEVIDSQGREIGQLIYGGGSTMSLLKENRGSHASNAGTRSTSAPSSFGGNDSNDDNWPLGVPETP